MESFCLSIYLSNSVHASIMESFCLSIYLTIYIPTSLPKSFCINRGEDLGVYASLGFSQAFMVLPGSFSLALGAIHASRLLHDGMLSNILRSPMSFFGTTPLGRILNRFYAYLFYLIINFYIMLFLLLFFYIFSIFIFSGMKLFAIFKNVIIFNFEF